MLGRAGIVISQGILDQIMTQGPIIASVLQQIAVEIANFTGEVLLRTGHGAAEGVRIVRNAATAAATAAARTTGQVALATARTTGQVALATARTTGQVALAAVQGAQAAGLATAQLAAQGALTTARASLVLGQEALRGTARGIGIVAPVVRNMAVTAVTGTAGLVVSAGRMILAPLLSFVYAPPAPPPGPPRPPYPPAPEPPYPPGPPEPQGPPGYPHRYPPAPEPHGSSAFSALSAPSAPPPRPPPPPPPEPPGLPDPHGRGLYRPPIIYPLTEAATRSGASYRSGEGQTRLLTRSGEIGRNRPGPGLPYNGRAFGGRTKKLRRKKKRTTRRR